MEIYTLYIYSVKYNRYVSCRKFSSFKKIKQYYNKLLEDNPPHSIFKYVPECADLNRYYIKHTVYKTIIEEENIIMCNQE